MPHLRPQLLCATYVPVLEMEGTGWTEVVILKTSPCVNSCRFRPSKDTQAELRASGLNITFNSTPAGTASGGGNKWEGG